MPYTRWSPNLTPLKTHQFEIDTQRHSPDKEAVSAYYHHWRQALEKVLVEKDILAEEQLHARANQFATGQRHHIG
jgi:hypothetical protein